MDEEYASARRLFGPFASNHEAIAVIREEYLELERSVFKAGPQDQTIMMLEECVQLAAMCLAFFAERLVRYTES
jgi:hypothetical protein